jgi:diaminohydroxyphosphoribosylaminopyrimidine deaminase/5-amino-6-(5-phosphoribosylamino)uracil reductase
MTAMAETFSHEAYMSLALAEARKGRGKVEPNPMVGAVIVREGEIVGTGRHERFGGPHAEANAIAAAGEACRGADLYVTLEPCTGANKKTPPCCDAIIRAGFKRVIIGARDTTREPAVPKLEAAGIEVLTGVLEGPCADLIAPFFKLRRTGRPWVIAKWAMTADGKLAARTGDSKWISCDASRRLVHRWRGQVDAVLVGGGTVRADDPLLTARPPGSRAPLRVVLDSKAVLAAESRLVQSVREGPVLVACHKSAPAPNLQGLRDLGCGVAPLPGDDGRPDLGALLDLLGKEERTNLLVEGGATVLGAFFDASLLDEVRIFVAPRLAGGAAAPSPLAGAGRAAMAAAAPLQHPTWRQVGEDMLLIGRLAEQPKPES